MGAAVSVSEPPQSTTARFRAAAEAADHESMVATLADDAVLHSPATFKPYEGREAVSRLLGIVFDVFEDFHYTDELAAPDGSAALIFRARVGELEVEGLDLLRFDDDGRIGDLTVMVRPLSGVSALAEAVGSRLQAADG